MPPRKRAKIDTGDSSDSSSRGARISRIMKKLTARGYSDDDLDARFDDKKWKWDSLFNDASILTEEGWETILPQLEDTILLRRERKASMARARRRSLREAEMTTRFSQFRPQLEHLTLHKLFLDSDLLELPVVKDLIEEDDCRVPLTEERWLTVQNILVQAISDHVVKIERDCYDEIIQAKYRGKELARSRWDDEFYKEWKKREEEIDREEEENGIDPDDPEYERPVNDRYLSEPPDDLTELERDYEFDMKGLGGHSDSVPLCLLSAQSLLEQEIDGVKKLTSYVDILRRRAARPLLPGLDTESGEPVAWCNEKISSSGEIVDTAVLLLRCLGLSPRIRMAYMAACGKVFNCARCYRGPASKGVTWAELVHHFLYEYSKYEELREKNYEKETDVPLRNDHTLTEGEYRLMGYEAPAWMRPGLGNKGGGPFTDAGQLYSQLAPTWGPEITPSLRKYLHLDGDEPVGIPWGDLDYDSPDEFMELLEMPYDDVFPEKCGLCAKLGVEHREKSRIFLNDHLEKKHGVDSEGHPLEVVNAN